MYHLHPKAYETFNRRTFFADAAMHEIMYVSGASTRFAAPDSCLANTNNCCSILRYVSGMPDGRVSAMKGRELPSMLYCAFRQGLITDSTSFRALRPVSLGQHSRRHANPRVHDGLYS